MTQVNKKTDIDKLDLKWLGKMIGEWTRCNHCLETDHDYKFKYHKCGPHWTENDTILWKPWMITNGYPKDHDKYRVCYVCILCK